MIKKCCFILACIVSQCLCTMAYAQYSIDLHDSNASISDYLKMGHAGPKGKEILTNNLYMTIGGKPVLPVMGEFHFSRHDHRFWKDALLKMKASGVNIVATYVLWIYHEEIEGRLNWVENNNLREFIELCGELGLLVHLRCGPYCNAETLNGGYPGWLREKGVKTRTNDPLYLAYARKWYSDVYTQVEGLLYKDGGPIMGLQIENEYVTENLLISHMMTLKQIAVEEGFDVPIYSMTHWMAVDFPKGEIIPYAGYYIETPWINSGKKELPISNFQFFSYNRISDNIGTDIIKKTGNSESLISEDNDSPYFTCEIGVGTPTFYYRRPIIPKEMAGANINLRLGCGVNLMGYYMYVGGTNRVGEITTLESSTGRVSYDYQAPIKEFGNLGLSMIETKKYNYFMNDFGSTLAPTVAYLPSSNKDTSNLQWAVRLNKNSGFLFCSNYLYKHPRRDYQKVQFKIKLNDEKLTIPRNTITVKNGTYFAWPFNQSMGGVELKYATAQPICKHIKGDTESYFFFADDEIPVEYLITDKWIKDIKVQNGVLNKEQGKYFINKLTLGKDCIIEIKKDDGKIIRFITLTGEESDIIWKGQTQNKDFVAFTKSGLIYDESGITSIDETEKQDIVVYDSEFTNIGNAVKSGLYTQYKLETKNELLTTKTRKLEPMDNAFWITPQAGNVVQKVFDGITLSYADKVTLRCKTNGNAKCYFNNIAIELIDNGNYSEADITEHYVNGKNYIRFESESKFDVIAETEVILKNGTRWLWQTDNTWIANNNTPVKAIGIAGENGTEKIKWRDDERIAYYEIKTPILQDYNTEVRLNISFAGDRADAYIGNQLVNDFLFDGSDWIFGINRYQNQLVSNPLTIRIKGFDKEDMPIYFEKGTDLSNSTNPIIKHVNVKKEYRFNLK